MKICEQICVKLGLKKAGLYLNRIIIRLLSHYKSKAKHTYYWLGIHFVQNFKKRESSLIHLKVMRGRNFKVPPWETPNIKIGDQKSKHIQKQRRSPAEKHCKTSYHKKMTLLVGDLEVTLFYVVLKRWPSNRKFCSGKLEPGEISISPPRFRSRRC